MNVERLSDNELAIAVGQGVTGAIGEEHDRAMRRHEFEQYRAGRSPEGSSDGWLGLVVLLAIPAIVIYLLVTALASGISAVANESLLAPLFPRPGDSLARYGISVATLLVLLPGGLLGAAALVRGRRLHFLRRLLIYPLAFVLVPTILFMTVATTTADAIRLPS